SGLQPLTARPVIGTPCNAKELGELYTALIESGKGRMERVQQSIDRGDIADLRLVEPLIHAMNDGYIGDLVADKAVPRLGAAIVAPMRGSIDFAKGRRIDARRLRAVVAADPAGSRDLLAKALAEGNAELRESALDAIADHLRGEAEFERPVLALVAKERSGGVFRAALRALAGYSSDATLEALTTALDDARTVHAAAEGLGHSRHPKALEWMLARLDQAVQAAAAARKAKKKKKDAEPAKPPANSIDPADMAGILLQALAKQRDPRIAAAAMPLIEDYREVAARAALDSADAAQLATIADHLAGDEADLFPAAASAAIRLGAEQAFVRMSPAFTAKDREKKTGQARLDAVLEAVTDEADPRWAGVALKQLDGPVAAHAIPLLGRFKERKALKPLLAIVAEKKSKLLEAALGALGRIGDPAAIPAILAHHASSDWSVRWAVQHALMAMDDPSVVDKVRTVYAAQKDPDSSDNWHLRHLLRSLESRFPGK
ncbi:MAG: HEAT repeat domain-containing protein, partial [Planctomycetes bacterium]|nr:HEAT repeat domain-containing protein [Planctomycetota bacterium]